MRRVRLTEGQLHRIIRNAVNEAIEDDNIAISDGSENGSTYKVILDADDAFTVNAEDEQDALEKVVAYIEKKKWFGLFDDDYVDEMDEEERDQMEDGGEITLVDATEYGAKKLHWIPMANMIIKEE